MSLRVQKVNLTTKQVSFETGIPESTLRHGRSDRVGFLLVPPHKKEGRSVVYDADELKKWLKFYLKQTHAWKMTNYY